MRLADRQRAFMAALEAREAPADARLAIYHRGVRAARRGALEAAYPVVLRLVGEAFFAEASDRHAEAFPPASGDLHLHGASFARFLEGYAPARRVGCLPDVARLEWALHECAFAAEAPPFDFAALRGVPEALQGELRLALHPAARLLRSAHPVLAIWEANQPGRDGTPGRLEGGDCVLVLRDGRGPRAEAVAVDEFAVLAALAGGMPLAQAGEGLGAERLAAIVVRHAAQGVICGFTVPPPR